MTLDAAGSLNRLRIAIVDPYAVPFHAVGLAVPREWDGVLTAHPPVQRPLELGSQRELAEVGRLLLVEYDALFVEGLVLHAVEALLDVADLGRGAVCGVDRGRHAVGAVTD